ncbi:patatin-like phospholipase family protein [Desulfococcaceae bacterium HSG7]|nr:patatin-like phospholipase family protein [Desulfococcaceae bacterium HSG7]
MGFLFLSCTVSKILKNTLENIFGDKTIGSIYDERGIGLCINSVNIANHGPRVFKTSHIPEKHADNNRKIVDVCLATSAAPIIFPIASIPDPEDEMIKECFVDGGLWANNPILVALIEALEMSEPKQPIEIISIGTCPPPGGEAILERNVEKGLFYWKVGINALELSMDAQASGYNFMAGFIADSFTKLGKKVRIYRLKQSPPSVEHSNYLSLDNASEKACSTLMQLGIQDGKEIYGKIIRTNSEMSALLKNIFENLPKIN